MCGVLALVGRAGAVEADLGRLMSSFRHRGPDDQGWLAWDGHRIERGTVPGTHRAHVLLGHQRLSILDLSASGHQPMSSPDDRYHVVYNGEIYNFVELRDELKSLGWSFNSASDTEVLIAAWSEWGQEALVRFEGMFAFVLLDRVEGRIYAARDHFGIKPLAYCEWQQGLAFCSEESTLQGLPGVGASLDPQTAYDYLVHGVSEHRDRTFRRGIKQLEPAQVMTINARSADVIGLRKYWNLDADQTSDLSFQQAASTLRDLFVHNVELHLRSDVPVGAALSGGIDSSSIVCAIREINPRADLHTFSYIADKGAVSEEKWVDIVGRHSRAIVHKVKPTSQSLEVDLPDLMRAQNVPFGSTSIYAQFKVFQLAAQNGIKVMLDGQGADEILAGYFGYRANALIGLLASGRLLTATGYLRALAKTNRDVLPGIALRALSAAVPTTVRPAMRRYAGRGLVPSWLNSRWLQDHQVATAPLSSYTWSATSLRESLRASIERASLPHLLRYEDRNSMFHSVESRVPFLTPRLVAFILSLPPTYIIDGRGTTKSVFREAMKPLVPAAILQRTDKIGFSTPEQHWLTHEKADWVEKILLGADRHGMFNAAELRNYWTKMVAGTAPYSSAIWRCVNLIQWQPAGA